MAKKKVAAIVKLQCPAGKATPAPPVGPALGPHGVPAPQFCQQFNERTQGQGAGAHHPGDHHGLRRQDLHLHHKTPPASVLIKKALGLEKGSGVPNKQKVGKLPNDKLEAIAKQKMPDLNANDIEAAKQIIAGTARSMGVETEMRP